MLSWKMAACLAAGNTVVIKPAQVSPLTALKFAELSVKAGIPPGVINVLPGTGKILRSCWIYVRSSDEHHVLDDVWCRKKMFGDNLCLR